MDILELKDLEKEYILSRCRLTLAQHHPPSAAIAGTPVSALFPWGRHTTLMNAMRLVSLITAHLYILGVASSVCVPCAGSASAVEMEALLVQTGLFDSALTLCQTFKLSLTPIFEGLTYK